MLQDLDVASMELSVITERIYPQIRSIYEEGIETGLATFETKSTEWEPWNASHLAYGRQAAVQEGEVLGWAALTPVSSRCVYGGVAELSVYVASKARGKGVGTFLLENLIAESEENGIWTLQAGIFKENKASIALHEKCGFRIIGYREKIGKLGNEWKDNVILERRSKIVGI